MYSYNGERPWSSLSLSMVVLSIQVNEKSFDLKEGILGWYKKEGDKTGMNGCMLPW